MLLCLSQWPTQPAVLCVCSVSVCLRGDRNTCLIGGSGKETRENRHSVSTQDLLTCTCPLTLVVKYFLNWKDDFPESLGSLPNVGQNMSPGASQHFHHGTGGRPTAQERKWGKDANKTSSRLLKSRLVCWWEHNRQSLCSSLCQYLKCVDLVLTPGIELLWGFLKAQRIEQRRIEENV